MPYKINPFTGKFDFFESAASLGAVVEFSTDDGNTVNPDGSGDVTLTGTVVSNATNATPLFTDGTTANTVGFELQVGTAITGAPVDTNDAGIVSFDDTQFTVDANGFVQLVSSGGAVDEINVDFFTAPGTDPVVPTAGGAINLLGNTVANGTNANAPVASHSRAANSLTLEVQVATTLAAAPVDNFDAGLSSFSDSYFSVDANGFVEIIGDLAALEALGGIGFASRTAANTWALRTITGATDGSIDVTNGNGVSGAPTISLNDRVRNQGIYWENIGFSYAAGSGTFTIHSASGSDFSSSNPGIIVLPSKASPGSFTTYSITSNQDFIDDNGASEIINNLFGLTTGVAYTEDIPFYLYAVTNDAEDTIQFMISRVPHRTSSPDTANIGAPDDAVADTQGAFFSLDNIDETLFDANPCICIGSFRMRMSASDDWTVQTLDNADGIGQFQEEREFSFPTGVMGAATGTYLLDNGGTAPVFSTNFYSYFIQKNGFVNLQFNLNGDGGTDGAGAVTSFMVAPYVEFDINETIIQGNGLVISSNGATTEAAYFFFPAGNSGSFRINEMTTAISNVLNSDFSAGSRTISGNNRYYIGIA